MENKNVGEIIELENAKVLDTESFGMPVIVDFYASWCGPCKMLSPVIEKIAKKFDGSVKVIKVDIDKNPELAASYEVMSVPTLLFFKDGKVVHSELGCIPEEKITSIIGTSFGILYKD